MWDNSNSMVRRQRQRLLNRSVTVYTSVSRELEKSLPARFEEAHCAVRKPAGQVDEKLRVGMRAFWRSLCCLLRSPTCMSDHGAEGLAARGCLKAASSRYIDTFDASR